MDPEVSTWQERIEPRKARQFATGVLFGIQAIFVWLYLSEIVVVGAVLLSAWVAYDYVQFYTKEVVSSSGKFVLVTGCDSGFGLSAAKAFRDLGFGVFAGCFNENSNGAKELRAGKKVEILQLDVTDDVSVGECAERIRAVCGEQGLWAVVNNSGINNQGYVELCSMQAYHRTAEVNLFGAIRVTKAVLPLIRRAKGRVVNCTSERGFNPYPQNSSYCISKFGLEAFSICLRKEMERFGVKVVTVAPGNFSGASSITNAQANANLRELILNERSMLRQEDQEAYPVIEIDELLDAVVEDIPRSCSSALPVVAAYVDAVNNVSPKRCYMVQGMGRQWGDPTIIMGRVRPFMPERIMPYAEKIIRYVFNR